MGDLRNKAKRMADNELIEAQWAAQRRREEGWTIFHFDLNPKLTRRNLSLGEAIRHLTRITGTRIQWWRCPVRGLSIQYRVLPTSTYSYDRGTTYRHLVFSQKDDVVEAKRELAIEMLLIGIDQYRGLPNVIFDQQVRLIKALLEAPPSVGADEWNDKKKLLHERFRPLLHSHLPELWHHLLGRCYADHLKKTGPTVLYPPPPVP